MIIEWAQTPPPMEDTLKILLEKIALMEGLPQKVQLSITIVKNAEMKSLNSETRGVNDTTDVLSFPTVRYRGKMTAKDSIKRLKREIDPDTGCYMLGDIVINEERVWEQALAYGHSEERELAYLTVHGFLHLLGYDHELDEDKAKMRAIEENALSDAGLFREGDLLMQFEGMLISRAKEAMQSAYVPYSGYKVGACVLAADGRVFSGCNVENASYGLSNCGERTAVFKAVSEGAREFEAIAIAAEGSMPYPCGACRQVLNEFGPRMKVIIVCGDNVERYTLDELLPHTFNL